jgi:hypothetical protein
MMDNEDKPEIQKSGISNEPETTIQTPIPTENKTLLLGDEAIDKLPQKLQSMPVGYNATTEVGTMLDTEPTEVLPGSELQDNEPDENRLRPVPQLGDTN